MLRLCNQSHPIHIYRPNSRPQTCRIWYWARDSRFLLSLARLHILLLNVHHTKTDRPWLPTPKSDDNRPPRSRNLNNILRFKKPYSKVIFTQIQVLGIGLLMAGFFSGASLLPVIPEIILTFKHEVEDPENLNDLSSGLFNSSFAVGEILGPLICSFLYEHGSFEVTAMSVSLVSIMIAFQYYKSCGF